MEIRADGLFVPLRVPKNRDWHVVLYLGEAVDISKSTAGTPIVLTAYNHGAANGNTVLVGNHTQKAANGKWLAQNVTAHTLELTSSIGDEAGRGGSLIIAGDYTGWTLKCQARYKSGDTFVYEPTIVFTNEAIGEVKLSGTAASTATLAALDLEYEIVAINPSGKPFTKLYGTFTIVPNITVIT